jgi:outer membrane protein assembly factor BamA
MASAKTADSSQLRRISILPVPAFGYSPETKAYVGAVCLFAGRFGKDTNTRISNAKLELNYSQRKQSIFEAAWNIFTPTEKFFSTGRIHFSKYPDNYWNQNNENDTGSLQLYTSQRRFGEFSFLARISKKERWFLGPAFRYVIYRNVAFLSPFLDKQFSDFADAFSPFGICLLKDTRNNLLNPTKGHYFQLIGHYMHNKPAANDYAKLGLEVRKYFSFKKNTLALKWKNAYSGGPPLDAAVFGGDETARGFYLGRYRPLAFSSFQAETRITIYRRWGIALFGGANYLRMNSTQMVTPNYLKFNAGTGLRFMIDRKERINLRFDYAIASNRNTGFYVAFGEAF